MRKQEHPWASTLAAATTKLVSVFITLTAVNVSAAEPDTCDKHPIYCQIVNNNPAIKKTYAFKLSNVIYKKSKQYKLNPTILTAIFAQESMYKIDARNCMKGLRKSGAHPSGYVGPIKVCTDFGIGQIHYRTADNFNFDLEKLTTDMEYSVNAAAVVLKDFQKRYKHREESWWTRYNASNKKARAKYKRLVERFISAY